MWPEHSRHYRAKCVAATALAAGLASLLGACGSLGDSKHTPESTASVVERPPTEAMELASCVETLEQLARGTPTQQAEILTQTRNVAEHGAGKPIDLLRYALVLALPGHPGSNSPEARLRLRQLVLATAPLGGLVHAMAMLELQRLDRESALLDESRRLSAEADRIERERTAPLNRRLQAELDENARLHHALDEARAKLDAIMNIERSITERKPAGEVKTP